jgi:hypothetical protein
MPIALESIPRTGNATEPIGALNAKPAAAQEPLSKISAEARGAANALNGLLIAAPVDLAAISAEIRRHPELESLVVRLGESLGLSADETVKTVEEAVVVLGTHRLRMLIDLWAMSASGPDPGPGGSSAESRGSVATPEVRYLENLLCRLGYESTRASSNAQGSFDRRAGAESDPLSLLTDFFMRDFFSLLPVIQPSVTSLAEGSRIPRLGENSSE